MAAFFQSLVGFIVFYLGGVALGWIVLPLVRVFSANEALGKQRCQRIVASCFKLFLWWLSIRLYNFGFFSQSGEPLNETYFTKPGVVIANHPSLLDIVLIVATIGHGTIIVHKRFYFNPLLGPLAWCCGYIWAEPSIGRGAKVVQDAVSCVKAGGTVIMFPEGTRSDAESLMRFRRGAFQIAQMASVPLIPLWLNCEPRYMGRNQGFRGYPKRGKVSLYLFPFVADQSEFLVEDARGAAKFWEERYLKKLNSFG